MTCGVSWGSAKPDKAPVRSSAVSLVMVLPTMAHGTRQSMTGTGSSQHQSTLLGRPKRIVLTAVGSLGDLHPYIAIALGLKARGHEAILATSACYRQKVEALGLGYRVLRPDSASITEPAVMPHFMHPRWGTVRCIREWILPVLRESYEDTLAAAEGADLLVSHSIAYATRLVSETTGTPWASTVITPTGIFSRFDPPLIPGFPGLSKLLRPLGPVFWEPFGRSTAWATRSLAGPWYRFRKELGLPPWVGNPLVEGHSTSLALALFSELLAAKQTDWPPQTVVTGFPIYDQHGEAGLPPDLEHFLDAGPPPIVFTVGFSAVTVAGRFYEESIAAARALGRRAVLVGKRIGGTRLLFPRVSSGANTPRSRNSSHGLLRSSTPGASARRGWRCGRGVPCWSCRSPTTSPTTPND